MISTIFILGLVIFILTVLVFYLQKEENKFIVINRLVFLTTTVSYAVMLASLWVINSPYGEAVYPTRWLFYIISCGLLMYEIGVVLNKSNLQKMEMIILNTFVMFTGFLASIIAGPFKWIFFLISCLAFILILMIIYQSAGKEKEIMKNVRIYITATWVLFPIVWFLAPTGFGLIGAFAAASMYLLLDIITKIVFSCYLIYSVQSKK